MLDYLSSLPGAMVLGLIWTIMALGVFITYKILNIADLTVDGSFVTGGIVAVKQKVVCPTLTSCRISDMVFSLFLIRYDCIGYAHPIKNAVVVVIDLVLHIIR